VNAWLTSFGGVAFLGALIALHWSYFRSNFSGDGRLEIRLPLTLDTGAKHLLLRPAAQSGNIFHPFPAVFGATEDAKQVVLDDCAVTKLDGIDLPSAVPSQSEKILIAPSISLAKSMPSLALPLSPLESLAPLAPLEDDDSVDRMIVNDSHLVLNGIVTKTELVCWGDVEIAADSVIGACMKVRGNMHVGANVTFLGSVVVNGNISTGEDCVFRRGGQGRDLLRQGHAVGKFDRRACDPDRTEASRRSDRICGGKSARLAIRNALWIKLARL
jgi:hypothetical protein